MVPQKYEPALTPSANATPCFLPDFAEIVMIANVAGLDLARLKETMVMQYLAFEEELEFHS